MSLLPSFTCPTCLQTGHRYEDVKYEYCRLCQDFTGTGGQVVRLGLLLPAVDAFATSRAVSRDEAVRILIAAGLRSKASPTPNPDSTQHTHPEGERGHRAPPPPVQRLNSTPAGGC